ncbi:hypothetical protein MTR_1g029890 [Medicago truncatula]|uniref:Uncharacterized protein n=1 Tax=Medicago truncatula TaxID=3880 RepID=A0A072VFE8_MEDTR|nr:hypothetical protein MTR_1g029890 [Medicago truncatula]
MSKEMGPPAKNLVEKFDGVPTWKVVSDNNYAQSTFHLFLECAFPLGCVWMEGLGGEERVYFSFLNYKHY